MALPYAGCVLSSSLADSDAGDQAGAAGLRLDAGAPGQKGGASGVGGAGRPVEHGVGPDVAGGTQAKAGIGSPDADAVDAAGNGGNATGMGSSPNQDAGSTPNVGGALETGGTQEPAGGAAASTDSGPGNPDGAVDGNGVTDDVDGANADGLEIVDIENVWSRHPTAFSLLTRGSAQFVAYYDAARQLTVAQRTVGGRMPDGGVWTKVKLGSLLVQCDSHNYVTMAIDRDGYLHVSGNMHGAPLVYYRSTRALDATSLVATAHMVGSNETQATYPQFFLDNGNNLIFAYRDGGSGKGNYIFNRYDPGTQTWARLINTPLIDGSSADLSAYPVGPVKGPDGWFHLVWVWRDTPDAATNHDLSYARTQDLVHWQNAAGRDLELPIVYSSPEIIVDPVQAGGGMINNNTKIGFDAQNRVILSYHKNDAAGTQLFNARREGNSWALHKTSSWKKTWAFSGQGTLEFEIVVEPVVLHGNGDLIQKWYHAQYGGWGAFRLDRNTLGAIEQVPPPLPYPSYLDTPASATPGMVVQWAEDSGASPDPTKKYMLRWETLPSNRDQCPSTTPPATPLRLYGVTLN